MTQSLTLSTVPGWTPAPAPLAEPSALTIYRSAAAAYESSVALRDYKTLADNYKALKPAYTALESAGDAAAMCRALGLRLGWEWIAPEAVGR